MDAQGSLDDSDISDIERRLSDKLKRGCWNCDAQDWLIFPTLLGEEFFDGKGRFMTSASLGPKVRITCGNCGNIVYFSAEKIGFNAEPKDG